MAAIQHGEPTRAMEYLREAQKVILEACPTLSCGPTDLYIPITPPALSDEEMAELLAEDKAAERAEAWERAKRLAADHGEAA